ncbi:MAG TPA: hypothetical protein VFG54_18645 [Prolixibacteraceae bacterium]|nr:hypothetical protein [Prolixibacteraceae bacterium]
MKSKFSLTLALLLVTATLVSAARADYTKNIKKAWPKSAVSALKVTNKFGEVKINDLGGDSVTIKVIITLENPSESKARELLSKIRIDFDKSGGLVIAETHIEEDFKSKQSFTIDYQINIPKNRDLDISNKYGNVVIKELEAKGTFNIAYGSMTSGRMKVPSGSPAIVNVSYGKADIESINEATMIIKYSKLYGGEIGRLNLDSKYSEVNLHRINNLSMDSKYDGINIEEMGSMKATSKYTNYKIGLLHENFDLDTGYGSVRINKVDAQFDNIKIINSYGGIDIGLNNLNYQLKAECSYCDVDYPSDSYKGDKIRENQNFSLDGSVGTGGGSVTINSRYGGVKLTE